MVISEFNVSSVGSAVVKYSSVKGAVLSAKIHAYKDGPLCFTVKFLKRNLINL